MNGSFGPRPDPDRSPDPTTPAAPTAAIDAITRAPGMLLVRVHGSVERLACRRLRDRIDRLLEASAGPVRLLEVDLSAVRSCDFRVLVVLDHARRRLRTTRARLVVRGLDPDVLGSFADGSLPELFAAYRLSREIACTAWPGEPGGTAVRGAFGPADARLTRMCLELATLRRTADGGMDVAAVTARLVDLCCRWFGVSAAVVLLAPEEHPGRFAVVAASTESSRILAAAGLVDGWVPVADCMLHGEPLSVPDLPGDDGQWPLYVDVARRHRVCAVRALPLRRPGGAGVLGALALFSTVSGPMSPADLAVAQTFADLTALALDTDGGAQRTVWRVLAADVPADHVVVEQAVGVLREREARGVSEARDLLDAHALSRDLHRAEMAREILARAVGHRPRDVDDPDAPARRARGRRP